MGKITAHLKKYFRCDNILHRKYVPLPQNKIYNRKERDKATFTFALGNKFKRIG